MASDTPIYLYKILTPRAWQGSQEKTYLELPELDRTFIHLAREDQVARICEKFWSHEDQVALLKLDVSLLKGRLICESNPGGENKYYHLYDGALPLHAVVLARLLSTKDIIGGAT